MQYSARPKLEDALHCLVSEGAIGILTKTYTTRRRWWWVALFVALHFSILACCLSVQAEAGESLLKSQSYWVDASGRAELSDVIAAEFAPHDGIISEGYTRSALWLKLEIAGGDATGPVAVVVHPPFLERIDLYVPNKENASGALHLVSGRDVVPDDVNHVGLSSGFIIDPSPVPRTVYLRISSPTTLTAEVDVMPLKDAMVANQRLEVILAVYIAFLIGLCLWGLVSWLVRREAIYGFFVFRQFYSLLLFLAFFGLMRFFYPDDLAAPARSFIYTFILVTVVAVTGSFDLKLLSSFGASRWLGWALGSILVLPVISIACLLLGRPGIALHFNAFVVNLFMVATCLLAFSVRDSEREKYGSSAIWIIRLGFVLMAFVIMVPVFMHLNVIKTRMTAVNFIFLHALLSASIMVLLLTIRARRRDLAAQQALLQVQLTARELREESQRRSEKEKFLSMLTHELRNPLGVIRLVADARSPDGQTIEKAAQDMAGVIERVEQSEKLDSQLLAVDPVLIELDKFLCTLAAERPFRGRVTVSSESTLAVSTDGLILRSVLRNLLDNAMKYGAVDTPIELAASSSLSAGRKGVRLQVINRVGEAGVPDPAKLYTKYYRSKRAHHQPGSGLGLFLVANWARALGGNVDYELQQHDDGSQQVAFSLWVPA